MKKAQRRSLRKGNVRRASSGLSSSGSFSLLASTSPNRRARALLLATIHHVLEDPHLPAQEPPFSCLTSHSLPSFPLPQTHRRNVGDEYVTEIATGPPQITPNHRTAPQITPNHRTAPQITPNHRTAPQITPTIILN